MNSPFRPTKTSPNGSNHTNGFDFTNYLNPLINNPNLFPSIFTDPNSFNQHLIANLASSLFLQQQNCWSKFLTDLALAQTTTTSSPSIYQPEILKNDVKKPKNSFSINDLINCDDTKKETTDETPLNLTTTSSRELNTQLSCFISNQDKLKPKIPEVKFESYNKNIGLIEEKIKQPLRFNFKRETIVKELTSNGVKGDVIYYSPCGKKLRNFQEIERYLYKFYTERNQKTGSVLLNKDNFTFSSKYIVGNYLILKETPSNNKFITQNNPINHNTIKDLKYDTFNEKQIRAKLTELYPEFRRSLYDAKSEFMSSETDLLSIKSETKAEIIEEKCVEKDENNFQIEKLNFTKDPRFVNIDPKKTEKYLQREKKTRQRWFDYILAQYVDKQFNTENPHESYSRVLDAQIEDMQQKYLKKIPDFENLNEKLNQENLSWLGDTLQIIEFLKNFSTQILQSMNLIDDQYQVDLSPLTNSINNLYSSLKSFKFKKELFEFVQILIKILLYNQEDESIEEFKDDESFLISNIKHFDVNESSFSEILRLYFVKSLKTLESHRVSVSFNLDITHNLVLKLENFISELNVKNFEFLNIDTKASMISHLCDDLLQNSTFMQMGYNDLEPKSSNLIIEYIDENIEKINKLKQDKIHVKKNEKKLGKKLSSLNTEIFECQKVLRSGLNLGQDRFKRSYWKLSESKEILIESNFDENIIEKKSFDEEIVNCMDDLVSQIEFKNLEENIVSKFSHLVELKQEPFSLKLNQEHPDLLNLTFENIQILIKNSIEYSTRQNIDCNYLSGEKCSSSKWWIMNVDNNKCSVLNTLSKRGFREKVLSKNLELLEKNENCKNMLFENFSNCPNFSTEKLIRKDKIKIIKLISNLESKVLSANLQMANRDLTQMGNSKETETSDEEDTEDPIHKARSKLLNLENSIDKRYLKYPFSFKKKLANYKIRLSNEIDRDFIDRVLDDMEDKDCNLSIKLSENICEFMKEVDVKSSEDLVGEDYEISVELLRWRRLVTKAQTTSQLSIYLDELNKLIEWDKSIMKASCHICNMDDNEEKLLLCDNCDLGYHTYCFKPKIDKIPSGDWYCFKCISKFLNIKHMCYVCGRDNLTHKADDYENKSSRKNINQNSLNKCEKCLVVFHTKCLPEAKFFKTTLKWHCLNCQTNKSKLVKNDSETSEISIQYKDTELDKPLPKKKGRKRKYPLPETNEVKQNEIETETKKVKEDAESKNDEIEEDDSMKKFKTFSEKLTQKKLKQQNELDLYKCRALLNEIIRSKFASHFMEKVSEKDYPDYYEAIKEPIDLTTIKDKLRNKKYENKEQFAYDCRLIFDNCEYFNEDDSLIGQAGHKLRALFETKWLKVFD